MKATIQHPNGPFTIDLTKAIDLSIPITHDKGPRAWGQKNATISPVQEGAWTGRVATGATVNFNEIRLNPHAQTTHTECLGHITQQTYSLNQIVLSSLYFTAELVSIKPQKDQDDAVISESQLRQQLTYKNTEAVIIRTLPNPISKKTHNYSGTNPPYLHYKAAEYLRKLGIKHLLVDLPSVDKEKDSGKLLAHKAFWRVTDTQNLNKDACTNDTITELIYVPNTVADGLYLLNIQTMPVENDAAPSRPLLFKIE
ncbi:MAG: cyclase family protein [Flavobacteriaceae bacterium]|nr:cyclase family protein [Flavobacteriaceae bacterium]